MVQPGDRIVYTVLITNSGQSDAREVVITDPIPLDTVFLPGTAQTNGQLTSIGQTVAAVMDKLFPGDIFSLTFTVILRQNPDELEIVNEAIVLAQGSDPPDPSVLLWVDSDGNGIPDIMEVTLKYYLPIIRMNFSD